MVGSIGNLFALKDRRDFQLKSQNFSRRAILSVNILENSQNISFCGNKGVFTPKLVKFTKEEIDNLFECLDKSDIIHYEDVLKKFQEEASKIFNIELKHEDNIFYGIPDYGIFKRFADTVKDPVVSLAQLIKGEKKESNTLLDSMRRLQGLIEFNKKLEKNGFSREEKIKIIESQEIKESDGLVANYSNKTLSTGVRLISGVIGALYLASDNYNMRKAIDDNEQEARKAAGSRFYQQMLRVGIGAYCIYSTKYIFEKQCNKSIRIALGVAMLAAFIPEILSRVFSKRAILPVSKNSFINTNYVKSDNSETRSAYFEKNRANLSFKGLLKKDFSMKAEDLNEVLEIIKNVSENTYNICLDVIKKDCNGLELDKKVKELAACEIINLGEERTSFTKGAKAVFVPIFFIKDAGKGIYAKINKKEKQEFKDLTLENIQNYIKNIWELKQGKVKSVGNTNEKIIEHLKKNKHKVFKSNIADFDQNTYSLWNKNLASTLSGIFLIIDDYNTSMKDSEGNEEISQENARKRAYQKTVSLGISAYIIALSASLFGRWFNSSLSLALSIVAVNGFIYETLTRKMTGFPIFPKNKEQLDEIKAKNENNKFLKTMGTVMGKKSFTSSKTQASSKEQNYSKKTVYA